MLKLVQDTDIVRIQMHGEGSREDILGEEKSMEEHSHDSLVMFIGSESVRLVCG